jgi:hypothetical protein
VARLFRYAASFDDSIETVIERLLDQIEEGVGSLAAPGPTKPTRDLDDLLPEDAYWLPILELLDEAGGSDRGSAVIDALEERLQDAFSTTDYLRLKTGETRWRNRARFARLRMKEKGLISATSPRGVWEMTPAGAEFLAKGRGASKEARR